MQRWLYGDISNFSYLMILNDLGSRSFNDISQYYVFPWTVINFTANKLDGKFFCDANNFRDLSKPVGALNEKRFEQIVDRYDLYVPVEQAEAALHVVQSLDPPGVAARAS